MKRFLCGTLNFLVFFILSSVAHSADDVNLAEAKIKEAGKRIAIKEYDAALSLTNEARRLINEFYSKQENEYLEDKKRSLENELKYGRRSYGVETSSLALLSTVGQIRSLILSMACNNYIQIAEGFLSNQQLDKAKLLYREIITSFDATKYRSCVKKAEFGIEDLRALEAKIEKEKLEKEQQAKMEQERLEREKMERERIEQEKIAQQQAEEEKAQKNKKKTKKESQKK